MEHLWIIADMLRKPPEKSFGTTTVTIIMHSVFVTAPNSANFAEMNQFAKAFNSAKFSDRLLVNPYLSCVPIHSRTRSNPVVVAHISDDDRNFN